jgi:hypothetical protein
MTDMPSYQTILSVGADDELISLRHAVLRSVGLNVFSTIDPDEAYVYIQPANCGVMLMCYSLEEPIRERLAKRFRECCPKGRIISISNKYRENAVFYGDVVFNALEGAEALIHVVRKELAYSLLPRAS